MRIVYVEDDAYTRITTAALMRECGHEVVAALPSTAGLRNVLSNGSCDVVVLDLDLGPGPTGLDVAISVRRIAPRVGILILSTYPDPRLLTDDPVLPPRTSYVTKRLVRTPELLDEALNIAANPADNRSISDLAAFDPTNVMPTLRRTQVNLLREVAEGWTNAEIADRQGVGIDAVEKSIQRLARRLKIRSGNRSNSRVLLAQAYTLICGAPGGGNR